MGGGGHVCTWQSADGSVCTRRDLWSIRITPRLSPLLPLYLRPLVAGANRDAPLPIKLFEVSDVVLPSDSAACGAVNRRRLVAVHCDKTSGFEVTHGLLNRVMESLRVPLVARLGGEEGERARAAYGGGYEWRAEDDATFFPGRCAAGEAWHCGLWEARGFKSGYGRRGGR